MKSLWAPWRIEYIKKIHERGCIFCQKSVENNDTSNLILFRGQKNFIIMNSYPYNPGHLMVAPYQHVASLYGLTDEELGEHYRMVTQSTRILTQIIKPDGFNIGMNLGRIAGAGIEKHIHSHVVPRWAGDTNFLPVMADTRVINEALEETYQKLVGMF